MLERKLREPFQSVFLLWSSLLWQHLSAVHLAFWAHTATIMADTYGKFHEES